MNLLNERATSTIIAISIIVSVVILSLFNRWEPCGESWGYWLFARIFSEEGRFIVLDRSPLYTLYLQIFLWLSYPYSVIVEYTVTTSITVFALVSLLKRCISIWIALFAALLWVPYLQTAEPPVQKLALACICFAVIVRSSNGNRFRCASFYALLFLAYLFRSTYISFIVLFLVYDIFKVLKRGGITALYRAISPQRTDWPIILIMVLLGWFLIMQSPHRWNNVWINDIKWLPEIVTNNFFVSDIVIRTSSDYVSNKYGTYANRDIYFIAKELFGDAKGIFGVIAVKPLLLVEHVGRNISRVINVLSNLTLFHESFSFVHIKLLRGLLLLISLGAILYGALKYLKDETIIVFVIGNVLCACATIISLPSSRYMVTFVPVLAMSACWYGSRFRGSLLSMDNEKAFKTIFFCGSLATILLSLYIFIRSKSFTSECILTYAIFYSAIAFPLFIGIYGKYGSKIKAKRWLPTVGGITVFLVISFFSNGITAWSKIATNIANISKNKEFQMMESVPYSMKGSFETLNSLAQGCNGVLALEFQFVGGFMNVPLNKIYGVLEIPPFGGFGDKDNVYDGLRPERINCVFVSNELANSEGQFTNYRLRYDIYIKPYVEYLKDLGATVYEIPSYGQAIVYNVKNPF